MHNANNNNNITMEPPLGQDLLRQARFLVKKKLLELNPLVAVCHGRIDGFMLYVERCSMQMLIRQTTTVDRLSAAAAATGLLFTPVDGCFPRSCGFITCIGMSCKAANEQLAG